jgi:hypothetical protein
VLDAKMTLSFDEVRVEVFEIEGKGFVKGKSEDCAPERRLLRSPGTTSQAAICR